MPDSEYEDDAGRLFCDRMPVEAMAPRAKANFFRWGMQVHEKAPGDTKVKALVLFRAAPPVLLCLDPATFDNANVDDMMLP